MTARATLAAPPSPVVAARPERIAAMVDALAVPPFSSRADCVCRYPFTPAFMATLGHVAGALRELGFTVELDAVGNLVARNRPPGEPTFALGSHLDSNRNGGRWDGTLGVVAAVEACRVNEERGFELPLTVIAFAEEEGSGFGAPLLGSRVVAGAIEQDELDATVALDDGADFAAHARAAGLAPERWREAQHALDGVAAWIEIHIEQARQLQDAAVPLGVVKAIAGCLHAEVTFEGRSDHAGGTPMAGRADAGVAAARAIVAIDSLAHVAGEGSVATVGAVELEPGLVNVIPRRARFTVDTRSGSSETFHALQAGIAHAVEVETGGGVRGRFEPTYELEPARLDMRVRAALHAAARERGVVPLALTSGAVHDTSMVARRVPSAMLFVPCLDGISHAPEEAASPVHAALAADVALAALVRLRDGLDGDDGEDPGEH